MKTCRAAALLFLLCSLAISAQNISGITGTVVDGSGAAVPNATVNLLLQGGSSPVQTTVTTSEGLFTFANVRPAYYDIAIEGPGFLKYTTREVKVDSGRVTPLQEIRLEVAGVTQTVEVTADVPAIQTTTSEIATTVTNEQVRRLPLLNRSAVSLVFTQAGVATGRTGTVINGQRASYTNVTMDGINIQDNMFRDNAIDFQPNLLLIDQVGEFSIASSNTQSNVGFGASQIGFVPPSGSNEYHGALYWYNRNNALAANDWFNNRDGVDKPFLNQNQIGGAVGGPIIKDKLLFYTNYEAFRRRQQFLANRTILTQSARSGIFTYRDASGGTRQVNVLQAAGVGVDPYMADLLSRIPGPENINNFRQGDSTANFLRNSAGYSFNIRNNRTRDNYTAKLDYIVSSKHNLTGTYLWNRDILDRPQEDIMNDFSTVPKVTNESSVNLLSVAWRWNPTPRLTNEFRFGFNLAPAPFDTTETFGDFIVDAPFMRDGSLVNNPVNTLLRSQGRDVDTYQILNNVGYTAGAHSMQFGFQGMRIRAVPYNDAGITPVYELGIGAGNTGLTEAQLPGAASTDRAAANNLLAFLAGYIAEYNQVFNVTSTTSGFVPGATNRRTFQLDSYAGYFQDNWRIKPRLTLNLGLRYEYYSRPNEVDGLGLLPILDNGNPIATLLNPNSRLDFAGGSGRPFYNKDLNNFAPNVGIAWDVFGDGKTAVRGGYSVNFVNDSIIAAIRNSVGTNDGLAAEVGATGIRGRVSTGRPPVPVPVFKVPRTFADNYALDSQTAFGMPDPNLRTPYVQQWSLGVQREIKGVVVEARYVGNKTTKAVRAFDFNQVVIRENGFLDDFNRARSNGFLARAATGTFNPAYTGPGSQPLTVFPRLYDRGALGNATVRGLLERGEVGELANIYQTAGYNVNENDQRVIEFFRNPNALGTNLMTNYSNASYNALQIDVRKRTRSGLQMQGNYTWGKVLSDSTGDNQLRFEPFLDLDNPGAERARAAFDIRHMIKGNWVYELPVGRGKMFDAGPLNWVIGDWSTSGMLTLQSGLPFSILSQRGTLNRAARSTARNTVDTTLTGDELNDVVGFFMTGNGPMFINPANIAADGRGAASDGRAPFQGQAFFNPGPGAIGSLQRRYFSSPWNFGLDFGVQKRFRITERQTVELRMESDNILNHPAFWSGDETAATGRFNINSPTFGNIIETYYAPRVIQFGLYYRF